MYGGLAEIADLPVLEVQDRLYDSSLAQRHRVLLSNGGIDARAPWARDGIRRVEGEARRRGLPSTVERPSHGCRAIHEPLRRLT